ncbi:MAG: hypothetical protein F8N36_14000 [Desulfovibrio sp.]|uniref:CZB domain-containing protein n=1 Tax=Desulfovibrio sp. TaxID=885 RepID=UPI00135E7D8A|nr:CZB domain-containing protein [Desulfovibrio sp.]MTJ93951.1 hypothetical protein [Desulfovibrio sp.]
MVLALPVSNDDAAHPHHDGAPEAESQGGQVLRLGVVGAVRRMVSGAFRGRCPEIERRTGRRRSIMAPVQVSHAALRERAVIFDISEGGALVHTWMAIGIGDTLDLFLAEERLHISGHIVGSRTALRNVAFDQQISSDIVVSIAQKYRPKVAEVARHEHQVFINRLTDAMAGKVKLQTTDLDADHNCQFGRWYHSVTDTELLGTEPFVALEALHKEIHALGHSVLAALLDRQHALATSRLAELNSRSQVLLNAIELLCCPQFEAAARA